jgi:secreted protein with Ig-like and vWFA domain
VPKTPTFQQLAAAARVLSYANIQPDDLAYPSVAHAAMDLLVDKAGLKMGEAVALVHALRDREVNP